MRPLPNGFWRPYTALLPSPLVIGLSTCGPVGLWGKAPGTNGSLLGLALYTLIFFQLNWLLSLFLIALLAAFAVVICDEGERRLQQRDPGKMVLDEVVAIPLCFLGLAPWMQATGIVFVWILLGFGLFRFFDILKPFGIQRLQRIPGGIGVVIDDLAAAVATNLTLWVGLFLWNQPIP